MAGALAARRLADADRDAILAAHADCQRSSSPGDSDAYYYDNERFHKAIYAASHSGFLLDQCVALHRRLQPYRRLQLQVRNRVATSFAEHGMIVDAILAGEEESATPACQHPGRTFQRSRGDAGEQMSDRFCV